MTDRELMQQALEALTVYDGTNGESKRKRVLAALRERLAQPEQEPDMTNFKPLIERLRDLENNMGSAIYEDAQTCGEAANVIEKLLGRLAQPVQEPVATVVARQYEDGTYAGNALDWAGRNCEDDLPVGTKLYTSQHPKQEQEPFCYHDGRNIVGKEYADHSDVFPLYTSPNLEQQKPVRFKCTVVDDAHPNGVPLSQWWKQHEMQPCAGRNCGSTNPNLHSAECFEDYEKATGMSSVEHAVIAGALFDFMGWLTSRKERIVLSSADNASPAVEAITEFAKMRGLSLADAKVTDWQDMMRGNDAA